MGPVVIGVLDRITQRPVFLQEHPDWDLAEEDVADAAERWADPQRYWMETVETDMVNFLRNYIPFRAPIQGPWQPAYPEELEMQRQEAARENPLPYAPVHLAPTALRCVWEIHGCRSAPREHAETRVP